MPTLPLKVHVKRLAHAEGLALPARASAGSAGFDLRAAIPEPVTVGPGERRLVPTGFVWEIPPGWEGQVRPRSGLALRYGLTVTNAPGTIDSDYRGEIAVALINLGQEPVTLQPADRIAQLLLAPVPQVVLEEVKELTETERGDGGFGSTGKS